jgi:hypothetical protein
VKTSAGGPAVAGEPFDSAAEGLPAQTEGGESYMSDDDKAPVAPNKRPKWMDGPRPKVSTGAVHGARHYKSVFRSDEEVRQIKLAARDAGWTAQELAKKFNKNLSTIRSILSGRTWKHVAI